MLYIKRKIFNLSLFSQTSASAFIILQRTAREIQVFKYFPRSMSHEVVYYTELLHRVYQKCPTSNISSNLNNNLGFGSLINSVSYNQTCFGTYLRLGNNVQSWLVLLCDNIPHVCPQPDHCAQHCADVSAGDTLKFINNARLVHKGLFLHWNAKGRIQVLANIHRLKYCAKVIDQLSQ